MSRFDEERDNEVAREVHDRVTPISVVLDDALLQLLGQKAAREFAAHRGLRLSRIERASLVHVGQQVFRKGNCLVIYLNDQCGFVIRYRNHRDEPREARWWTQQEVSNLLPFTF
jgi:hypothetical protein